MFKRLLFCFSFLLCSCSAIELNRIAPAYQQAYIAIQNYFQGVDNFNITPLLVNEIPYASALLRIDKGPIGLVILESVIGDKYIWVSQDNIYIVIENGRIIETRGFDNNLIDYKANYSYKDVDSIDAVHTSYYSYDFPKLKNLPIKVRTIDKGFVRSELFMKTDELRVIEEEIYNEYLDWKRTNRFWIDQN